MSECTHDCSTCSSNCGGSGAAGAQQQPVSFLKELNPHSRVDKVIGIVSGKGGVGKSLVTSLMASALRREGETTAVLDADITGPSIPKMFGVQQRAKANDIGLLPAVTSTGIQVMSLNLLVDRETTPVVWRGPVIAGTVEQFWTDVIWQDVNYMFVDMPPGTGDVPLTVMQSLPVDGIIIVASPQDLVSMIVSKAVEMAHLLGVRILGLVENMSYLECPDCGKKINVFGESKIEETAEKYCLDVLGKIPINPELAAACDAGKIEYVENDYLKAAVEAVKALPIIERNKEERK